MPKSAGVRPATWPWQLRPGVLWVHLDLAPGETQVFRIDNLRFDSSACPFSARGFGSLFAYLSVDNVKIDSPQHILAVVRNGIYCEARAADNSWYLPGGGLRVARSVSLPPTKIATLRYTEGFASAFKSRAPTRDRIWNTHEWCRVLTGESGPQSAVFASNEDAVEEVGLADCATRLQASFSGLPAGTRVFVSAQNLGFQRSARLVPALLGGEPLMMEGIEANELPVNNGHATAIWEVIAPLRETIAGFLDFAVFVSRDPTVDTQSARTIFVAMGFWPQLAAGSSTGPIPMFSSTISTLRLGLLTIEP
jgi:hypothetical protein